MYLSLSSDLSFSSFSGSNYASSSFYLIMRAGLIPMILRIQLVLHVSIGSYSEPNHCWIPCYLSHKYLGNFQQICMANFSGERERTQSGLITIRLPNFLYAHRSLPDSASWHSHFPFDYAPQHMQVHCTLLELGQYAAYNISGVYRLQDPDMKKYRSFMTACCIMVMYIMTVARIGCGERQSGLTRQTYISYR